MSRFVALVVTGVSALALSTVAGPTAPVLDRPADAPAAGGQSAKGTGNWCC